MDQMFYDNACKVIGELVLQNRFLSAEKESLKQENLVLKSRIEEWTKQSEIVSPPKSS